MMRIIVPALVRPAFFRAGRGKDAINQTHLRQR
jgi:hypothetical protein